MAGSMGHYRTPSKTPNPADSNTRNPKYGTLGPNEMREVWVWFIAAEERVGDEA
jgi:hypothetical protein